ncbi:MAG TPA: ABC transporter permease [Burkholderiales bacterium]|nr:ABC transporter permease [Burkholderiales bacterium]
MPVGLPTDYAVWLLVAAAAGYAMYVRRQPHLAAPWRRVAQSTAGMSALVVLVAFVVAGLLDSVHFRPTLEGRDQQGRPVYGVEVLSLLDVLVMPLKTRTERTYSAPFATRAYARETTELPSGGVVREFPRLRYGGAHLADEADHIRDVAVRTLQGIALGFAGWWLAVWLATAALARRHGVSVGAMWNAVQHRRTEIPWRAVYLTVLALTLIAVPVALLATRYHVLGTDKVGQDVLYLSLKSIRTGLVIGTLTTLVMLPLAILLGIMAGYFRGWIDDLIQYVYTTINSIPGVLLIAAAVLMMQVQIDKNPDIFPTSAQRADFRLLLLCVILGLTTWTGLARLLRGETLKLSELEYIQAAHAFGVRHARVITRHLLPNVMHIVLITLVMDFSGLVLAEAVLSYVGVGVDPSTNSFGTMINAARLEMAREPMVWWTLAAAFAFMFVLVLAANLFADAVRDGFDPRVLVSTRAAGAAA